MFDLFDDRDAPKPLWRRVLNCIEAAVFTTLFGVWSGIALLTGAFFLGQLIHEIFG